MQYAMRNLHPERLFTVRPLKAFAYILTAHMPTLCVVVSNCIDITSPTRPMLSPNVRRSPLTGKTVASIDYRTSRN